MESTEDWAEQIRALERSEAAPYIDQPTSSAWLAPAFGTWSAAYVGVFALWNVSTALFVLSMLGLSALIGFFLGWYMRRFGALPMPGRGNPPAEIRREYRLYAVGVLVIAALVVLTWWAAGLAVASATAFVLVTAGYMLYAHRYERAASAVRERLQ